MAFISNRNCDFATVHRMKTLNGEMRVCYSIHIARAQRMSARKRLKKRTHQNAIKFIKTYLCIKWSDRWRQRLDSSQSSLTNDNSKQIITSPKPMMRVNIDKVVGRWNQKWVFFFFRLLFTLRREIIYISSVSRAHAAKRICEDFRQKTRERIVQCLFSSRRKQNRWKEINLWSLTKPPACAVFEVFKCKFDVESPRSFSSPKCTKCFERNFNYHLETWRNWSLVSKVSLICIRECQSFCGRANSTEN